MYRVSKVLNNNGIIAINMEENQEYVLLGKGVGFGKKVSQRFEAPADCTIYRLAQETERGSAKELAKSVAPEFLEIADEILREAEKTFGDTIDRRILFPLADHISFAVGRIRNHEQISNPLTDDIKVLFYSEFKVAERLKKILKERMDIEIDEHEVGYVALHIHSALGDEKVSVAMQTARTNGTGMHCHDRDGHRKKDRCDLSILQPYDEPYQIYGSPCLHRGDTEAGYE